MLEAAIWYKEHLWGRLSVSVNLTALAFDAGATPLPDVSIDAGPDDFAADEVLCCADSPMSVVSFEKLSAE